MATAGQTHHVVLQTSASGTITGLMLARTAEGAVLYSAHRRPILSEVDLKITQNSWHLGYGDYLYRTADPYRYAFSDGIDLRHPNGAQLVPLIGADTTYQGKLDYLLRNPGAERNEVTSWTKGTGVTYTIDSTAANVNSGTYSHKCITDGSRADNDVLLSQSLANPTVYQSREITVGAWIKSDDAFDVRIEIYDGVDTTEGTASHSSTYTYVSATKTIGGAASEVTIRIAADEADPSAATFYVDDFVVIPTGGVVCNDMIEYDGATYLACGRVMAVWDETNDVFDGVLVDDADEFVDLEVHGGYVLAAHGDTGYAYSNDTSDPRTTWTDISPTQPSGETGKEAADFLVSAGNFQNILKVLRANKPNSIYGSSETYGDPLDAHAWSVTSGFFPTVGEKDKNITGLYAAFDSVLVGREDGLYYYYAPTNEFRAATTQFKVIQDAENFDIGLEFVDGWFYTNVARYGLIRLRFNGGDVEMEQIGPRFSAPMYDNFGGRVRALGHDGTWLYALQDTPVADTSATKTVNLMAARYAETIRGVDLVWHTLRASLMGEPKGMLVESDCLWFYGRRSFDGTNYEAIIYRMFLPTQHNNMMKEATVNLLSGGTKTFVTSIMDYADEGWGPDDKGLSKVVLRLENISANITVTVKVQVDDGISDSGPWTAVGSAIASTTTDVATVSFTAPTTCKRFRLQFTFVTNVTTSGPIMREFTVHAVPHPDRYFIWELTALLESGQTLLSGAQSGGTAQNVLANIATLDAQDYPLKFNDLDGTQYNVQIMEYEKVVLPTEQGPAERSDGEHLTQGLRMVLREMLTS